MRQSGRQTSSYLGNGLFIVMMAPGCEKTEIQVVSWEGTSLAEFLIIAGQ